MSQTIERSTKPTATTPLIDRFQAAKKYGIDCWAVFEAIQAGKLTPVSTGKRSEDLVVEAQVKGWLAGLSPLERPTVFSCTRKGCAAKTNRSAHHESQVTADGRVIHGHRLFDNRPTMPDGTLRVIATGEPGPDQQWAVLIKAIGDGPWEIEVEHAMRETPVRTSEGRIFIEVLIPDAPGLLVAMNKAAERCAELNSKGQR